MIKKVLSLAVGVQRANVYFVLGDNGKWLMIDCGAFDDEVKNFIAENDIKVEALLITHGHFDHVYGVKNAVNEHIAALIGENELDFLYNERLNLGSWFGLKVEAPSEIKTLSEGEHEICGLNVKVIATPGHTEGSVCYLIDDCLFTGDTMFFETYGRCDLPTSDMNSMISSLNKLFKLDGNIKVYPGHGRSTTIAHEKEFYGID